MLLADSHIIMVVGVDVHVTTAPPLQSPPLLHRYGDGPHRLHTVPRHERERERAEARCLGHGRHDYPPDAHPACQFFRHGFDDRAREHELLLLPDGFSRGDAFKSQGIYGNDLQRRGHSFFGSIEQGRQEKVQVHSNPLRPDILLHSHSDRCACHGGRSLCPRLGRYADGTSVKHRLQHAAQFCPCHIEGYEESGEKRRKFI